MQLREEEQRRGSLPSGTPARSAGESADAGLPPRGRRSKRLSRRSVWKYARMDSQPTPSERSASDGMLLLSCCRPPVKEPSKVGAQGDGAPREGHVNRNPSTRKRKPPCRRTGGRSSKASRGDNPRGSASISLVQQLLLEGGSPPRYYVLSDGRRARKPQQQQQQSSHKNGVDATSGNDLTDLSLAGTNMGQQTYLETPPPLRARTDLDVDFSKPPMVNPGLISKPQQQLQQLHRAAAPACGGGTMISGGLCNFMECGAQVLQAPTYMNLSTTPMMLLPEYNVVAEPCLAQMGLDFYTVNTPDACPTFVLAREKVPLCYSQPSSDWR